MIDVDAVDFSSLDQEDSKVVERVCHPLYT